MKVVYYKMITIEGIGKRLAKYTATLRLLSDRRGVVESITVRPVDNSDKISPEYKKLLIQNEIGMVKNIKSCYSYESN